MIDKNRQIEEMANDIEKSNWKIVQDFMGCHINSEEMAEHLYNAGYRKQSEGHWYKHDKKKHGDTCYYCSVCEKMALADCMTWELTDYCPNCGARMKGDEGK